ncbi:class I SAM-dependent methyltransferase [Raoultibacter timonensis]|uniref:class I SAM-dependent methyltransferase n=1 Tax=Raoultibacter timonensis TaxID=1907662 RepID=UPI0015E15E04|nr:class I SAM-dependent methyltransferase [Raoultibacter timonensis]
MDTKTEQNLAASMTADTTVIIPYLAYLLQDFWELGSSPDDMVELLADHVPAGERQRALDLGCGKGAVAIALAKRLAMRVKGIDAIPEFIGQARSAAIREGVSDRCSFEIGDITVRVLSETGYDCTVYGAVGPVLGEPEAMLAALRKTLRSGGHLLLDDAYANDGDTAAPYPTLDAWNSLFENAGFEIVACRPSTDSATDYDKEMGWIAQRVDELSSMHPEQADLFAHYLKAQRGEYDELLNDIVGATWLLRARSHR